MHFTYFIVITTKSGSIRGIIQSSSLFERKIQKFVNIPYAEAPVGQLRFEKPQPKKPWKGNAVVLFSISPNVRQRMFFKIQIKEP